MHDKFVPPKSNGQIRAKKSSQKGSFLDLQLSEAIASKDNAFGLTISAIGPTFGFCALTFVGGAFIAFAVKGDYNKYLKFPTVSSLKKVVFCVLFLIKRLCF